MAQTSHRNGNGSGGYIKLFLAQLPWVITMAVSMLVWAVRIEERMAQAQRDLAATRGEIKALSSQFLTHHEADLILKNSELIHGQIEARLSRIERKFP